MEHLALVRGNAHGISFSSNMQCADSSVFPSSSSPGRGTAGWRPLPRVGPTGVRASIQNNNDTATHNLDLRLESGTGYRGKLRLFIDSAETGSWKHWLPSGVFYGVTTNPILLEKAKVTCQMKSLSVLAKNALQLGAKEVQLQTWGWTSKDMINTGFELAKIDPAIVVKIPITKVGLEAAKSLTAGGVRVTMTGVYSVHQALLAVGVGAAYAAPYLGRMIALGKPGMEDIQDMQKMVTGVKSDMRLLVASIKSMEQLTGLAAQGVNSFAVPVPIIEELFQDPDTETATAAFQEAVSRNHFSLFM